MQMSLIGSEILLDSSHWNCPSRSALLQNINTPASARRSCSQRVLSISCVVIAVILSTIYDQLRLTGALFHGLQEKRAAAAAAKTSTRLSNHNRHEELDTECYLQVLLFGMTTVKILCQAWAMC